MAGVTYERLEGYKTLHWPVAEDGSDQPLLYTKQFNFPDGKATLFPTMSEPTDQQDAEYDLHLNNGRLLEHFHEGNMTYRSEGIREKMPCTFVEVSPELAKERGIQTGSWVQLTSRYGKVRAQAVVTDRVQGKELYMPMNSTDEPVNRLTSSHTDKATHTPAYKSKGECAEEEQFLRLKRKFLSEGVVESQDLLGGDAKLVGCILHRWIGCGGSAGILEISERAQTIRDLICRRAADLTALTVEAEAVKRLFSDALAACPS